MKALAFKPETPLAGGFYPARRISPLLPKNSVWKAFQAGMRVLYRYASRSRVDSASIAKANLQLLHRTLLTDPSYRETLTSAELEKSKNGLPTLYNLLFTQGLSADLITIQQGCSIQISSCEDSICMFLTISGKAVVDQAKNSHDSMVNKAKHRKPWWRRINHSSTENLNREGDFMLLFPENNEQKTLNALENNCVLLSVTLAVDHRASNRY